MSVMWTIALNGRHLATSAVMRLKHGDLFSKYFCMEYFISFGVNDLTGRERRRVEFKNISTVFMFWLSIISEQG